MGGDNNESLSGFSTTHRAKTKGYERYKCALYVACDTHIYLIYNSYQAILARLWYHSVSLPLNAAPLFLLRRNHIRHRLVALLLIPYAPLRVVLPQRLLVSRSSRYLEILHTFVTLYQLIDISPIPIDVIDLQALLRIPRPDVLGEPI